MHLFLFLAQIALKPCKSIELLTPHITKKKKKIKLKAQQKRVSFHMILCSPILRSEDMEMRRGRE